VFGAAVPRYFFHTQTSTHTTDVVGVELASPFEAKRQAIMSCGEMMQYEAQRFWGSKPWTVSVTTEAGLVLCEIHISGSASAAAPD
jgi:hypothetical protein